MANINDTITQLKALARQCRERDDNAPEITTVELITQRAVADLEAVLVTLSLKEKELSELRLEIKILKDDNKMKENQITILSEKVD